MTDSDHLAVLIAYTGDGGVEKMMNNLLGGFVAAGVKVDLLLLKARGSHVAGIPQGVRVTRLNVRTSLLALPALYRYLRRERPRALLVAKDRAGRVALLARRLAGVPTRVVLRLGMHLSGSLAGKSALRRWSRYLPVRLLYPWADRIVTVAEPIAEDIAAIGRIPMSRFEVIRNPVVTEELHRKAGQAVAHPWLTEPRDVPVILGAGRFKAQKDFPTLLLAFALLRKAREARLIVLGEGPDRKKLLELRERLGIDDAVDFPGFTANPYAWMRHADLFVLSSRYEGSPNVLTEAMAVGVPVVATDCPSGPRELLQDGRYGPLVVPGDTEGMAAAMAAALDRPLPAGTLREAVADYTVENSSAHYLRVLGWEDPHTKPGPGRV